MNNGICKIVLQPFHVFYVLMHSKYKCNIVLIMNYLLPNNNVQPYIQHVERQHFVRISSWHNKGDNP